MKQFPVQRMVALHDAILTERAQLLDRLRVVNEQLEAMGVTATQRQYGLRTPTGRARNKQSLRKTVQQVLSGKSMTREQILDAVLRAGYQFSTNDPMNSLGVVLYGRGSRFQNNNGLFRLG